MPTPKNLINLFDFTKVLANGVAERQSEDEDRIMLRFIRAIRNKTKQPRNSDGMTLTENSIIALRRAFAAASNANFFLQLVYRRYSVRIYSQMLTPFITSIIHTGVDNLKSSCVGSVFFFYCPVLDVCILYST